MPLLIRFAVKVQKISEIKINKQGFVARMVGRFEEFILNFLLLGGGNLANNCAIACNISPQRAFLQNIFGVIGIIRVIGVIIVIVVIGIIRVVRIV